MSSRILPSGSIILACNTEQAELHSCFNTNATNPLACRDFVQKYSACAASSGSKVL